MSRSAYLLILWLTFGVCNSQTNIPELNIVVNKYENDKKLFTTTINEGVKAYNSFLFDVAEKKFEKCQSLNNKWDGDFYDKKELSDMIANCKTWLAAMKDLQKAADLYKTNYDSAKNALNAKKYDESIQYLEKCKIINRKYDNQFVESKELDSMIEFVNNLKTFENNLNKAKELINLEQYSKAIPLIQKCQEINKKYDDKIENPMTLTKILEFCRSQK